MKWLALLAMLGLSGCSFILDFDDVEDLPCDAVGGCLPDFVCLENSNRCVPTRTVDRFKSCPQDTPLSGDELCPTPNDVCRAINDQGPRCLPKCTPVNYATTTANSELAAQCPVGTTCWELPEGGGVCSEGICDALVQNCPGGQRCADFNGAGVCFTSCDIFQGPNPFACAGGQVCHPIGTESLTGCVDVGTRTIGEECTSQEMCEKSADGNRTLMCGKPLGSSNTRLSCFPICSPGSLNCPDAGQPCLLARPNIDPVTGQDLGICGG